MNRNGFKASITTPIPNGRCGLRAVGAPQYGSIYYNTSMVKASDFKSVWDFLNPKWKGKIGVRDIRTPGPGNGAARFLQYSPKIGAEFLKRLVGEMDVTIFREPHQGVDWLANGKFPICFFCGNARCARRESRGCR